MCIFCVYIVSKLCLYCVLITLINDYFRVDGQGAGRSPPVDDLSVKLTVKRGIEAKSYNDVSHEVLLW